MQLLSDDGSVLTVDQRQQHQHQQSVSVSVTTPRFCFMYWFVPYTSLKVSTCLGWRIPHTSVLFEFQSPVVPNSDILDPRRRWGPSLSLLKKPISRQSSCWLGFGSWSLMQLPMSRQSGGGPTTEAPRRRSAAGLARARPARPVAP